MAIIHDQNPIDLKEQRKKIPNVDNAIQHFDHYSPNGRSYQSSTFTTQLPDRLHFLKTDRHQRYTNNLMITVHVDPVEGYIPNLGNTPLYEQQIQYFNSTQLNLLVTNRQNITMTLPRLRYAPEHSKQHFVIRKTHRFNHSEVAMSVYRNYEVEKSNLSIEDVERKTILLTIEETKRQGGFKNPNAHLQITIDRIVPIDLLSDYQSVYISDLDLLIRKEGTDLVIPHPTSEDAVLQGEILDIIGSRRITGAFYDIVDNNNEYSSRYICLGKSVVQIPIRRDPGREDGIYYTQIDNVNSSRLQITMNHCDINNAHELGIFSTREEAETKGNVSKTIDLELSRVKHENERLKAIAETNALERKEQMGINEHHREMEKLEAKHRTDMSDLAAKNLQLETALKMKEREQQLSNLQMERKDYYEDRSYRRKDTSELIKWAPALITGVVGIGTYIMLQKDKG